MATEPPRAVRPDRVKAAGARPGFRIVLIGNYRRDRQESMQRFADVIEAGLRQRGVPVLRMQPAVLFGHLSRVADRGFGKWLGYLDKFLLFPLWLRLRLAFRRNVLHIGDHSNALYGYFAGNAPVVATCHDLLAVRGALGEDTDCPASPAGRYLQRGILAGLSRATLIACSSTATRQDVERLVDLSARGVQTRLALIGLNHSFRQLPPALGAARLPAAVAQGRPWLLHVGSNLPRKNRAGVLRIFQRLAGEWPGDLVFAGQALDSSLREMVRALGLAGRVIEITEPDSDTLEALYNSAFALLFPSRHEGFGWPVIEAQACGCPVLCSTTGPFPEVAGRGAILHEVEDEAAFARSILELRDPAVRNGWIKAGLLNVTRFTTVRMIDEYLALYQEAWEMRRL